jgi:RNA polymerase sigma-70 factor (ECF subfamily)
MDAAPIPLETLLAHRAWVRSVARAVVRDENAADDLEQETWVAAITTPPRHASSLRGWFGTVVRSRARRASRTQTRRTARETAAARGVDVASPAELAEIADTHRRVVEAVVALEEPYRAAILLRYFEGLAVEEVARRTSSPLETTRSRLKRGVTRLRERLARELGSDERPWHLALVPLTGAQRITTGATAAGTGGAIVATKATWAAIGVVVAAGAAGIFALKPGDDARAPSSPEVAQAPAAEEAPRPKPPAAMPRLRAAAEDEKPAAPPPVAPVPKEPEETAAQRLQRVKLSFAWERTTICEALVDLRERSGVEMMLSAEVVEKWDKWRARDPESPTIERLSLDMAIPASQALDLLTQLKGLAWGVEEPRVVIVPKGVTRDPSKALIDPATIASAPKLTVVGRVVDENGAAVPGAKILRYPGGSEPVATADIAGRFELKLRKPYGALEAHAPLQIPSLTVPVEGEPGSQVTIELATRGPGGGVKVRVVADADGKAIASAQVLVGLPGGALTADPRGAIDRYPGRLLSTDEQGFASANDVQPGSRKLIALCKGYVQASADVEIVAGRTAEVTLRMSVKAPLAERLKSMRVSFNFQAARAGEIVKFLNDAKQLSIVVDPALAPSLEDLPVTLRLEDVSVATALNMLCKLFGGTEYVIDEESDVVFLRAAKK